MRIATKPIPADRSISFRQAVPADAEILGALMDVAYQGTVDHEGESPAQCVEEMRGTLTGKYGPLLDFASFLLERAISALHAKGYPELFLVVTDANTRALSLYKKLGFEHRGESHAGTAAPASN
jgi:hypothetical protein